MFHPIGHLCISIFRQVSQRYKTVDQGASSEERDCRPMKLESVLQYALELKSKLEWLLARVVWLAAVSLLAQVSASVHSLQVPAP